MAICLDISAIVVGISEEQSSHYVKERPSSAYVPEQVVLQ
jgi:hypothetical protein